MHLVWVWAVQARLVFAQQEVKQKSNEMTTVPLLLEMLDLQLIREQWRKLLWMKAYSLDLRERVVGALLEGASVREVALRFGVSHDTVSRYQLRHEQGQGLSPRPRPGRARRVGPEEEDAFVSMVRQNPSATLDQMSALWHERTGVWLPQSTLHDQVRRLGGRFKKNARGIGAL